MHSVVCSIMQFHLIYYENQRSEYKLLSIATTFKLSCICDAYDLLPSVYILCLHSMIKNVFCLQIVAYVTHTVTSIHRH